MFAALFVARLYDIQLGVSQVIGLVALSIAVSVGGVGLPSGASYFGPITPVFLSLGLPAETIPVLFAVDTIPEHDRDRRECHGGSGDRCDRQPSLLMEADRWRVDSADKNATLERAARVSSTARRSTSAVTINHGRVGLDRNVPASAAAVAHRTR